MLTFNLKKEWFEKIKSGEKTTEYRKCGSYWDKRVLNLIIKAQCSEAKELAREWTQVSQRNYTNFSVPVNILCCFKLGYPKTNDNKRILNAKVKRIFLENNKKTNLKSDLKTESPLYGFEFEVIKND